jgi:quercetin dioxygenase-like cupin family protein
VTARQRAIGLAFAAAAAIAAQTAGRKSFTLSTQKLPWTPITLEGAPPGLEQKVLHDHKEKGTVTALVRFPKGYREPRHYHNTCGHTIYVLRGRLRSPEGVAAAGTFLYSAPQERHGPFTAEQETEILFATDGPFDYIVDDQK